MIATPRKQNLLIDSDDNILAEIWNGVARHGEIRAIDADSFSVSVQNGVVGLTGHVIKQDHRELIEEIVCSVPGVNTAHNKLVVDSDLAIQVATSLAKEEWTRHFILPVGCAHGWVRIGGIVPSQELKRAAEEIAAQIPSVRGVLSRPGVIGEVLETEPRAIQPQIQAKVYDHNRQEGLVTWVLIQPRNRLVTHAVVSISDFHDGKFVVHEHLVPVEAMEVVNKESIFLKRSGLSLNTFPAFNSADYSPAPAGWQSPYPYITQDVRWNCSSSKKS